MGVAMFERFTDTARRVVVLAQEEARLLGHNWIGTEHLLLGLVHGDDAVGAKGLAGQVDLDDARERVRLAVGETAEEAPGGHIPFTPRAKHVLEMSLREALQLGHNYIGTEHILLALMSEHDGLASQILVAIGVDEEETRARTLALVLPAGAYAPPPPSPEPPLRRRLAALEQRVWRIERRLADLPGSDPADTLRVLTGLEERITDIERRLDAPATDTGETSA